MKQETWKALNWMDRTDLQEILENYGFAVNDSESNSDLRETIAANIEDGTISENDLYV